jgi:hypothetical protein
LFDARAILPAGLSAQLHKDALSDGQIAKIGLQFLHASLQPINLGLDLSPPAANQCEVCAHGHHIAQRGRAVKWEARCVMQCSVYVRPVL